MSLIAIIGGTGVCDTKLLQNVRQDRLPTFYGMIHYLHGTYGGKEIIFLPRHGKMHSIPPHLINYRANILGLKRLGVTAVFATTAVGTMTRERKPGNFVLPDQFIDFTNSRHESFFDGGANGVVHVDMTTPYCPKVRAALVKAGEDLGYPVHNGGTYVCTSGPRFETPAEIRMFRQLGGDVVGMTTVPEVCLAKEAEICYATVSMITNYAAGIADQPQTHAEVNERMEENSRRIQSLLMHAIELYGDDDCECRHGLAEYGGFKA